MKEKLSLFEVLRFFTKGDTCCGHLICAECPFFNGVNCTFYEKAERIDPETISMPMEEVATILSLDEKRKRLEKILEEENPV
jgi:hypothetical protein